MSSAILGGGGFPHDRTPERVWPLLEARPQPSCTACAQLLTVARLPHTFRSQRGDIDAELMTERIRERACANVMKGQLSKSPAAPHRSLRPVTSPLWQCGRNSMLAYLGSVVVAVAFRDEQRGGRGLTGMRVEHLKLSWPRGATCCRSAPSLVRTPLSRAVPGILLHDLWRDRARWKAGQQLVTCLCFAVRASPKHTQCKRTWFPRMRCRRIVLLAVRCAAGSVVKPTSDVASGGRMQSLLKNRATAALATVRDAPMSLSAALLLCMVPEGHHTVIAQSAHSEAYAGATAVSSLQGFARSLTLLYAHRLAIALMRVFLPAKLLPRTAMPLRMRRQRQSPTRPG